MDRRIWILTLANFAVGTSSYVFTGLLAQIARDLDVSLATAGQLASVFALTFAFTAPFLAGLTAQFDRRRILGFALVGLGLLNGAAALSAQFEGLLAIRIACGLVSTLISPVAGAAAVALVAPEQRGRALAMVLAGMTVALAFGIPAGTAIGGVLGWQATFAYAGLVCLVAAGVLFSVLPPIHSGDRPGLATLAVAFRPPVFVNLLFTVLGFMATFSTVAYMGPVISRVTGLTGSAIGALQLFVGFGAVLGVLIGGVLVAQARTTRPIAIIFGAILLVQIAFALEMRFGPWDILAALPVHALTILASAACLFAMGPLVQARLVACAPSASAVVLALNGSMIFLGQGVGAVLGGAAIAYLGLSFVGYAGALIAGLGIVAALAAEVFTPTSCADDEKAGGGVRNSAEAP